MSRQRREAEMTWILVRMGVECPTFALQDHVSTVVIGRKDDCALRCPGKKDSDLSIFYQDLQQQFVLKITKNNLSLKQLAKKTPVFKDSYQKESCDDF